MDADHLPRIYLYRRLVQAKLFMERHCSERIDLDNIADEASFSKFHFIRVFKSVYGLTPHQYLTKVRVAKARTLLERNLPVTETCVAVGFESLTSFAGLFRKVTGTTPSAYQRRFLEQRRSMMASPRRFIPNCFLQPNGVREE